MRVKQIKSYDESFAYVRGMPSATMFNTIFIKGKTYSGCIEGRGSSHSELGVHGSESKCCRGGFVRSSGMAFEV